VVVGLTATLSPTAGEIAGYVRIGQNCIKITTERDLSRMKSLADNLFCSQRPNIGLRSCPWGTYLLSFFLTGCTHLAGAMPALSIDALVVGTGFGGIYQLKRLLDQGLNAIAIDAASDVGGTWYWNRYPGAMSE
jgi:hypothetical protein